MKKAFKRLSIVWLALCIALTVFAMPASADNVCKQIRGTSAAATTFLVKTGERWIVKKDVLKLSQTKGEMRTMKGAYYNTNVAFNQNKATGKKTMYEKYSVEVQKLNQKNQTVSTQTYIFDSGSLSLKLERNTTYRITVTPTFPEFARKMQDRKYYVTNSHLNPYSLEYEQGNIITRLITSIFISKWKPLGWSKNSVWNVSSTKGIISCS